VAPPRLSSDQSRPVELAADRQHVGGLHAGGNERLVAVAQDEIGDVWPWLQTLMCGDGGGDGGSHHFRRFLSVYWSSGARRRSWC
jgi:hypothetical protein